MVNFMPKEFYCGTCDVFLHQEDGECESLIEYWASPVCFIFYFCFILITHSIILGLMFEIDKFAF